MASPSVQIPVIDLSIWMNRQSDDDSDVQDLARQVAACFEQTGVLIVRDPRVSEADNNTFTDLMEKYYNQPDEVKIKDARPELFYQVGATPENTEVPRCRFDPRCESIFAAQAPENKAHKIVGADPKWRFFWRIGERPTKTEFQELNAPGVVPEAFKEDWPVVMNMWGGKMLAALSEISRLAALGLGLPRDQFADMMNYGPHLLAPTGSNLNKYNSLETVFAGFHTDLNFLTIHGKSRFPGLFIWLRDGTRTSLTIPDGCLLVQAGQQFEYLTGGHVKAGYHEVVVTPQTVQALERARSEGRPCWRVSSTLFGHLASDHTLEPLGRFANAETVAQYPPIKVGAYVANELKTIQLAHPEVRIATG